jgi:hypothetical protein
MNPIVKFCRYNKIEFGIKQIQPDYDLNQVKIH